MKLGKGDTATQRSGASGFLVGSAVFKAVEALLRSAWWVRFPSAPVFHVVSHARIVRVRELLSFGMLPVVSSPQAAFSRPAQTHRTRSRNSTSGCMSAPSAMPSQFASAATIAAGFVWIPR